MIHGFLSLTVHNADDILLLKEGRAVVANALKTLSEWQDIGSITVMGNDNALLDFAASQSSLVSCIPHMEKFSSHAIPYCYEPWPSSLSIRQDATHVLILSARNPFISKKLLTEAFQVFKDLGGEVMTSVVASTIHPCQLFSARPAAEKSGELYLPEEAVFAEKVNFPEAPHLWTRDAEGYAHNQINNRRILGRQDFPETVEPDGTFILARLRWAQTKPGSSRNTYHGFRLSAHESIQLGNKYDHLRYLAMLNAIEIEKGSTAQAGKR